MKVEGIVIAAVIAVAFGPVMAQAPAPSGKTDAAKAAETTAGAAKVPEAGAEAGKAAAGEKAAADGTATEKKELTPEEKAALAEKEAALAEAKAKAMGAGEPRALIVDILGFSEPQIDAFDELNDGASILLAAQAELAMTYYPTCEDLTIRGGRITITGDRMTLDDGEILSRAKGQCPGNVKLSPADVVNASVVTRSAASKPTISTTPRVIGIAGPGAANYTRISVYGPEGPVFEADLKGRGAAWPEEAGKLEAGKQYTIVLTGPDIQMFAARVKPDEKASPVTVFRIQ